MSRRLPQLKHSINSAVSLRKVSLISTAYTYLLFYCLFSHYLSLVYDLVM